MTIEENKIITWYCEKCPHTNDDVGEFQESSDIFKQVKEVHQNHKGWQKGKPKESLKNGVGGNDSFNEIDIDDYNDSVKEVNKKIDQESKSFNNKNYDLVAEIIQSENNFLTFRETKEMWNYDEDEGM